MARQQVEQGVDIAHHRKGREPLLLRGGRSHPARAEAVEHDCPDPLLVELFGIPVLALVPGASTAVHDDHGRHRPRDLPGQEQVRGDADLRLAVEARLQNFPPGQVLIALERERPLAEVLEAGYRTDAGGQDHGDEQDPRTHGYATPRGPRRNTFPGSAPVWVPSSTTATPFTITAAMPDGYRCGSS